MNILSFLQKEKTRIFIVWLIIFLGLLLRIYRYDYFPTLLNSDELFTAWNGISLIRYKKPISLTILEPAKEKVFWESYSNYYDPFNRFWFNLTSPYFDHPPLGGLILGSFAYLFFYKTFTIIPAIIIRFVPLLLSIFSSFLLFVLANKLFGFSKAVSSLLIYSFVPTFIYSHRLAYLENFLVPIILLDLIILLKYVKESKRWQLSLLILLSLIAGWIKIIGYVLLLTNVFWLIKYKKKKEAFLVTFSGVISIFLFFIYGFHFDWPVFKKVLTDQSQRGTSFNSFIDILNNPKISIAKADSFIDGWIFLGYFSIISLLLKNNKNSSLSFLLINFIFWLLAVFITNGPMNFGWYRFPLYPFLSIALGFFIDRLIRYPSIFEVIPLFLLAFVNFSLLEIKWKTNTFRLFFLIIILPYLIFFLSKKKALNKFCQLFTIMILVSLVLLNSFVVLKYPEIACKYQSCPLPQKIVLDF